MLFSPSFCFPCCQHASQPVTYKVSKLWIQYLVAVCVSGLETWFSVSGRVLGGRSGLSGCRSVGQRSALSHSLRQLQQRGGTGRQHPAGPQRAPRTQQRRCSQGKDLGPYLRSFLVLRVAPSDEILRKFLEL